jgi:hypothetical protein
MGYLSCIGVRHLGTLSHRKRKNDPEQHKKMGEKLDMVCTGRYFIYGLVLSFTSFFAVYKVETDIIMVYNVTSLELNDYLWDP